MLNTDSRCRRPTHSYRYFLRFQVKNYKQNILTNGYWDYVLYHSVFTGVDFDKDYVKMVESLTSADVKNFARKLLKPGNRIEVTMTTGKS